VQKQSRSCNDAIHSYRDRSHSDKNHRHDKKHARLNDCITQIGDRRYSIDHTRIQLHGRSYKNRPYSKASCDEHSSNESLTGDNKYRRSSHRRHGKHTMSERSGDRSHCEQSSGSSHEVTDAVYLQHYQHHHCADWFINHIRHKHCDGRCNCHSSRFQADIHGTQCCTSRSFDQRYHRQCHRSSSQNSTRQHKRYSYR